MEYCRVIVEGAPFVNEEGFTYHVPSYLSDIVSVGSMVFVPFGKGDKVRIGFVVEETCKNHIEKNAKLKDILLVNVIEPVLTQTLLTLCRFVSDYYACALIYAIKQVVPKYMMHHAFVELVRCSDNTTILVNMNNIHDCAAACAEGSARLVAHDPLNNQRTSYYRVATEQVEKLEEWLNTLKRAPKQKALLKFVFTHECVGSDQLKEVFKNYQSSLQALLMKHFLLEVDHHSTIAAQRLNCKEPTLTDTQNEVLQALLTQLDSGCYEKNLINGVTGSGKTLIYEKIAEACIAKGRQVLFLVPEIALSQQLYLRLKQRFGSHIVLLHSQLSERERFQIWKRAQMHDVDVVLGPRSALFLPYKDLGLVIIDEEHEASYKQSEPDPRYHAIRVAEYLMQQKHGLLLLGSATPSVETLYEVVQKICHIYNMPERVHQAALPKMQLVDMSEERRTGNHGILSGSLQKAVQQTLDQGEQAILLINRKGYSSSVICQECGEVLRCPRCDIPLTYYQSSNTLRCNYCEYHLPMVAVCPSCGSSFLEKHGTGTESVEEECARLFPNAQVARLDAQALTDKASREQILKDYAEGRTNILVGTQLLAKGLDFLNTTCIGVIHADLTLNLPDFRSAERCFQLMVQVAGRAGRDKKASTVYIQTYQPNHYAFKDACRQSVHQFFLDEIAFRQKWLYPPVVRLCRIIVSDFDTNEVEKAMRSIYNYTSRLSLKKDIIGPSYAPMSKKNNRYRMHLIIKTPASEDLQGAMKEFRMALRLMPLKNTTRVLIDIDPENIF